MPLPSGSLSVPLRTIKVPGEVGHLAYTLQELPSTRQARLSGRFALRPEIDMKDFETRAVIDWLTVGVTFKRQTQIRFVQGEIAGFFERTPHIKDYEESRTTPPTGSRSRSRSRTSRALLRHWRQSMKNSDSGLNRASWVSNSASTSPPTSRRDLLRAKMHRVLSSHLLTDRDILTNALARHELSGERSSRSCNWSIAPEQRNRARSWTARHSLEKKARMCIGVSWTRSSIGRTARPGPMKHWRSKRSGRGSK